MKFKPESNIITINHKISLDDLARSVAITPMIIEGMEKGYSPPWEIEDDE